MHVDFSETDPKFMATQEDVESIKELMDDLGWSIRMREEIGYRDALASNKI